MELEQLLQLISAVSESKLTDFRYEENGVKLCLKKEAAGVRVQNAGTDSLSAAAMAQEGMQTVSGASAFGAVQAVPGMTATMQAPAVFGAAQAASGAAQSAEAAVVVQAAAGTAAPSDAKIVKSPLVGVFYASPSEDKGPYVSVGDTVKKGQILACVEAMKLMNEIESEYDGVVAEILVESGQGVGYGEPLFVIR